MFKSFFPNPRWFFLSVVGYSAVCVFIWYGFNEQIGAFFGLDLSKSEPVIGLGHFLTDSFLLFMVTIFLPRPFRTVLVYGTHNIAGNGGRLSAPAFILFSTYFSVQVSVAINNWRRPFFDLVQSALKTTEDSWEASGSRDHYTFPATD